MIKPKHLWRRAGRWLRRTVWLLGQMRTDFGFGGTAWPIWLRDNPFLLKSGRTEMRRQGLSLRLAATVVLLGGLMLGGLSLETRIGSGAAFVLNFLFHSSLPVVLFVVLTFVHVLLIANVRTAMAVSLANEARRATLPDLLMTPLRRAEMLLAMGVGPARSAFLLALAGLPVYALLGQFGGLTFWEIVCLYVLFALLCYQPPAYAVPALSGLAATPDAPPGQFAALPNRRAAQRVGYLGVGFPLVLGFMFFGQFLGALRGGWLAHLFSALQLNLLSGFSFLLVFSWPYYAVQLLSDRLPFFHLTLSPLVYVLPLTALSWAGSALSSASALSSGDLREMHRLPLWTRAQTVSRWTARLAGLCALGVVWRAWVESGDTASLAQEFMVGPGWDAAGLLLLLVGFSLPNVCGRALAVDPRPNPSAEMRSASLVLRRALKRALRPLGVAAGMFVAACVLGGLSPFAAPVYRIAGNLFLAGVCTVFWAVGVRRAVPKLGKLAQNSLLYLVPFLALSAPGCSLLAAFSPASLWVRLFAGGPGLIARFPLWTLGPLPSFWVCAACTFLAGAALMTLSQRQRRSAPFNVVELAPLKRGPASAKRVPARNEARTAALLAWITARTDNPLFTYEMRVRTRSGRWFDWLILAPAFFAGAVIVALVFPAFVVTFSFLSPFRFFTLYFTGVSRGTTGAILELASLLLLGQCYLLGFRGQVIGENLIVKDRQQGTWGFLLISPLTIRQIFWGKVFGQTSSVGMAWAAAGLGSFLLYGVSVPSVGVGPALAAWASGQIFVLALFTLGVGLGTTLATFPPVQKTLRGLSTLLFVLVVGGAVYVQERWLPIDTSRAYSDLSLQLLGGSAFGLLLAALLFWLAQWRLTLLRHRDIAAGDGLG